MKNECSFLLLIGFQGLQYGQPLRCAGPFFCTEGYEVHARTKTQTRQVNLLYSVCGITLLETLVNSSTQHILHS